MFNRLWGNTQDDQAVILKRLLFWSAICGVSAAPSFIIGAHAFHIGAMLLGIATTIAFYTLLTSTEWFKHALDRPFVRTVLSIGFSTRLAFSTVLFPIGCVLDAVIGAVSIELADSRAMGGEGFWQTLTIVFIDGALQHMFLLAYMAVVYLFMRLTREAPVRDGFCVRCGYDLRASPVRCPECGELVRNNPLCDRLQAVQRGEADMRV